MSDNEKTIIHESFNETIDQQNELVQYSPEA
jgi:hypothetical protein